MNKVELKIITIKALRQSFTDTQSKLLEMNYMDDQYLVDTVRDMQAQYDAFRYELDDLKKNHPSDYEKFLMS